MFSRSNAIFCNDISLYCSLKCKQYLIDIKSVHSFSIHLHLSYVTKLVLNFFIFFLGYVLVVYIIHIRIEASVMTKSNKIFSGYQLHQFWAKVLRFGDYLFLLNVDLLLWINVAAHSVRFCHKCNSLSHII
jgi:hypothetical protein